MDGIDETDPRRMALHDQRAGPDTVAEEAVFLIERLDRSLPPKVPAEAAA
jgi:hypothetical protein